MKKNKVAKQFLKEFSEVPFVSFACQKVGVSRNTIYKWRREDPDFKREMDRAERAGTESITDVAQSKLLMHVARGMPWAIQFLLRNRHKNYAYPRVQGFEDDLTEKKKITGFRVTIVKPEDKPQSVKNDDSEKPNKLSTDIN